MKKILFVLAIMAIVLVACNSASTSYEIAQKAQEQAAMTAATAVPIPTVSYFQEKRTIAKWAQRWDKPSVPTYVYLVSFGKVLGYYVADGKPASTRSYLMPESTPQRMRISGDTPPVSSVVEMAQSPDIDGTYGDNNPGIRFFTAEGAAVEWAGDGASYLYSDVPLPFDVPRLNPVK